MILWWIFVSIVVVFSMGLFWGHEFRKEDEAEKKYEDDNNWEYIP